MYEQINGLQASSAVKEHSPGTIESTLRVEGLYISASLVANFSWRLPQLRYYRYTGHLQKGVVQVPKNLQAKKEGRRRLRALLDNVEHTPLMMLYGLLRHQLVGWQSYVCYDRVASSDNLPEGRSSVAHNDRFDYYGALLLSSQRWQVVTSGVGLL